MRAATSPPLRPPRGRDRGGRHRRPGDRRGRRARAGARGVGQRRRLALHDRVADVRPRRARPAPAAPDRRGHRPGRCRGRRRRRGQPSPGWATRCSARSTAGPSPSTSPRRPTGSSPSRRVVVRGGRHSRHRGRDRTAGPARLGPAARGSACPGQRRVGWRRHLRRADREGTRRRARHGRVQHGQRRDRRTDRRRPRRGLHPGRPQPVGRALRPDLRQRRRVAAAVVQPDAHRRRVAT